MTLVWASGYNGVTDPDAQTYIAAVEAADGQAIEGDVALAINDFVVGCKLDGIWDAIKASCILAGARTLSGALVPLVGTAPTNYNFVSGDYNRETGLVGNGSTKYLDSNRNNGIDPQNNIHLSAFVSQIPTVNGAIISSTGSTGANPGTLLVGQFPSTNTTIFRSHSGTGSTISGISSGFVGSSRSLSTEYIARTSGSNATISVASDGTGSGLGAIEIYRRNIGGVITAFDGRLAFYSIGESLDLAALDTRVTTLMTDIGAAIP